MIVHDLHTHTPFSGCGKVTKTVLEKTIKELDEVVSSSSLMYKLVKETVLEYLQVAKERKVKVIGFTDHYGAYTNPSIYHKLKNIIEELKPDIIILVGAEVDIVDENGGTTISDETREILDYTVSGQHHYTLSYVKKPPLTSLEKTIEYIMKEIENTFKNPLIDAIGHPWVRALSYLNKNGVKMKLEDIPEEYFYKTCELAIKYNKPIQVDYRLEWEKKGHLFNGIGKVFRIIAETGCLVFYGSDTHNPRGLAENFQLTVERLKKYGFKEENFWNIILK